MRTLHAYVLGLWRLNHRYTNLNLDQKAGHWGVLNPRFVVCFLGGEGFTRLVVRRVGARIDGKGPPHVGYTPEDNRDCRCLSEIKATAVSRFTNSATGL